MTAMREKLHEQELATPKMHEYVPFEILRKDTKIQCRSCLASIELEDAIKRKDFE